MSDEPTNSPSDPESPAATALEALLRRTSTSEHGPGTSVAGRSVPRWMALTVLVAAIAVGWAGWHWVARPAPIEDRMPMAVPEATDRSGSEQGAEAAGESRDDRIVVHVAGAVLRPGVVTLAHGARIGDAISTAGGLAPGADVDRLNLAAPLDDGARVFVPIPGQPVPGEVAAESPSIGGAGATGAGTPVDLNHADAASLETLPGVGPATASAILSHRDDHGDFASVDQLLEVRGIGEAKLEALDGLVTVR